MYHIDHLGPFRSTSKQYKHIFAIIDSFTKFCWLQPTKSTTSNEVISKLKLQSSVFGNPSQIVSDRGTAFTSTDFDEYCKAENITHTTITTGVSRSNGQIERLNSTIIAVLTKLSLEDPSKWYKHVEKLQQVINSTYSRRVNTTPFELLFGIKMNTKEDLKIKELIEAEHINNFNNDREKLRQSAKQSILKIQAENKRTYNLRGKPARK